MNEMIKELIEEKKNSIKDDPYKRNKLIMVEAILKDDKWFLKRDINSSLDILVFLGVPREEAFNVFMDLVRSSVVIEIVDMKPTLKK